MQSPAEEGQSELPPCSTFTGYRIAFVTAPVCISLSEIMFVIVINFAIVGVEDFGGCNG